MQPENSPISTPWSQYLDQIEISSKRFWEQHMLHRGYIRMQNINVWHDMRVMIDKIAQTLLVKPLKPCETFLLHTATYLYEAGWQRANAPQLSRSQRFTESSRMIHESVSRSRKDIDFGLLDRDPATIAALAKICQTMSETDLTALSRQPEQSIEYEETARLAYLIALLQLADLLLIRRANRQILRDLPNLTDTTDITDARLTLQPYITRIDLQPSGLKAYFRIHENDKELANQMHNLFAEPIKLWWQKNWSWLHKDFGLFLTLHEPDIEIVKPEEAPPLPLKSTCKALIPFLEQFQPSIVELPSKAPVQAEAPPEHIIVLQKPPDPGMVEKAIDVGIVIALEEEFAELFNEIKHRYQAFPDGDTGRQHYLFEQTSADGSYLYRCVATFVGEMGPMLSGLVTHRLIERWQPKTLVMLGIAAAMNKDVHVGDVVVAKQIDSYFDSSKAVPDQDPSKFTFAFSGEVYRSSSDLLNATRNFKFVHGEIFQKWQYHCQTELEQLIPQAQREQLLTRKLLRDQVQAVTGDIASGPTVGAAQAFIDWLKKRNRKYAALEMEAAGFMAAIHEETSAKRTLVLRAISDYGDERKHDLDEVEEGAFRRYAMRNAIQLLWRFFNAGILPHSTPTNPPEKKTEVTIPKQNDPESILAAKREHNEFDVFLHCNDEDKPVVRQYAKKLQDLGILPWFEEWEVPPGVSWQTELEKYIQQVKSAAVFIGKTNAGKWERLIGQALLREFIQRECPVIPVLLPEATETPNLPPFLASMKWVDFRRKEPDPLNQLIWGITGKRPDQLE